MARITLKGEPKSTQHVYKFTCRGRFPSMYMTAEGKAIKESYAWQAKSQWKSKPIEGDCTVSISLHFGTKRKADIDNFSKLLFDSLTGIAWLDDSQIKNANYIKFYDKKNPRIEIEIQEYEKETIES